MKVTAQSKSMLALLCWVGASGCSYITVGPGKVGVVRTPNGTADHPYPEGEYQVGFYDTATLYDALAQEHSERVQAIAKDGASVTVDLSIRFHIIAAEVVALDRETGTHYYSTLIGPTVVSETRRAVGRFNGQDATLKEREAVEREIREGTQRALQGRHIVVEAVLIQQASAIPGDTDSESPNATADTSGSGQPRPQQQPDPTLTMDSSAGPGAVRHALESQMDPICARLVASVLENAAADAGGMGESSDPQALARCLSRMHGSSSTGSADP